MKKLIIITESIDINDSSGSKANVALIKNLHKAGLQIKVYHYTRKDIQLEGIPCVSIKEQKLTHWYFLSKAQLFLRRITSINLNPLVEKYFGFSFTHFNDTLSIKKAILKERDFNPDGVLTLSKAASFRPHKALLGIPKWHKIWLAYVHDPYPMHFYPAPYNWVENGFKYKQQFLEKIIKNSNKLIFPSYELMRWMDSCSRGIKEKHLIIPHQSFQNIKSTVTLPNFFDSKKLNLLHAGSLLKHRDPRGIVLAFQKLLEKYSEAKGHVNLIFIGIIHPNFKYFFEIKTSLIKELKVIDEYLDFKIVNALQNVVDVNIILEADAQISPFLPGKFPHCVASNKIILHIGPKLSETIRLLGNDYPYHVENRDDEKMFLILEKIYLDWKNGYNFKLNRDDLKDYLSIQYLKSIEFN